MRSFVLAIGILFGGVVIAVLAIDEGEVVTLTTYDASGKSFATQLWLVERDDGLYLRAHSDDSAWLTRVRERSRVELTRGENTRPYAARPDPDPALQQALNDAMQAKYGTANRLYMVFLDPARTVPVRLEPVP